MCRRFESYRGRKKAGLTRIFEASKGVGEGNRSAVIADHFSPCLGKLRGEEVTGLAFSDPSRRVRGWL